MLLEALEAGLRGPLAETSDVPRDLTVEHVLPQSWEAHWPLPDGADPEEARNERQNLLHTIGNLTLLSSKLNPMVSNGSWETKRAEISKHTVLHLNKALVESEHWDEEAIRARSRALLLRAERLWLHPKPISIEDISL
jgi:hypothetical protein